MMQGMFNINGSINICENRLQYLVQKGAVLRKGQRVRTRFCKFIRGPPDSFFTAVLYVSDSSDVYRYSELSHLMCSG